MKNWTINYSIEEKLEILEKEWLPIVIEKSSQKSIEEETIEFLEHYGFMPMYEKSKKSVNTFQDYLNERPLILFSKRTVQSTCHPLIQGF